MPIKEIRVFGDKKGSPRETTLARWPAYLASQHPPSETLLPIHLRCVIDRHRDAHSQADSRPLQKWKNHEHESALRVYMSDTRIVQRKDTQAADSQRAHEKRQRGREAGAGAPGEVSEKGVRQDGPDEKTDSERPPPDFAWFTRAKQESHGDDHVHGENEKSKSE